MKSAKHSNKIRSRFVSFAVCAALILCTVFSFGLFDPVRVSADGDRTVRSSVGIRFAQVAAGEDFAIGLTYDRKLYGWSLKTDRNVQNPSTLGDYYPEKPIEIDVTFRVGPGTGSVKNKWDSAGYKATRTDDSIESIAATRTTAVFTTRKGYIYTWGNDNNPDVEMAEKATKPHYLLLRNTDQSYDWKVPYIIDYNYYSDNDIFLNDLIPTSDAVQRTSIAAGEYNYIFLFEKQFTAEGNSLANNGRYYFTYVWGSLMYSAANASPTSPSVVYNSTTSGALHGGAQARRVAITSYIVPEDSQKPAISVVAGGYTVGINGTQKSFTVESGALQGTSLQLHGKNFLTTQNVTAVTGEGDNTYAVTNTTGLIDPAVNSVSGDGTIITSGTIQKIDKATHSSVLNVTYVQGSTTYTINNAIAGGNGYSSNSGATIGFDTERYYARQNGNLQYAVADADPLTGSGTDLLDEIAGPDSSTVDALKPVRYSVSLGNDVGYGVTSDGKLYGWGDNTYGQLALPSGDTALYKTDPYMILNSGVKSVASGKQLTAGKAFYGTNTFVSGSTDFGENVKNSPDYITGVLMESGAIKAWANLSVRGDDETAENKRVGEDIYFGGISDGRLEKFAAVYSGYGNNLFAVTTRGKLVRITVKADGTGFDQYVYDEFLNADKTAVENWKTDNTNSVIFTVPAASEDATETDKLSPSLGHATFYVWSASTSNTETSDTVKINASLQNGNYVQGEYKSLVSENNIGDAYRIIGLSSDGTGMSFLKADNLTEDNYAPVFKFDGNVMTAAQQDNMFTFGTVADSNGVGIRIQPKQSSKGKKITAEFWVARYNGYDKFTGTADAGSSNVADNAVYYDYKKCSIEFEIQDTPTVMHFAAFDTENGGASNVPLLDPNNEYNANYSLAVQNVSEGVNKLIAFLKGDPDGALNADDPFKTAVLTEMRRKDVGFPDSEKIDKGNLTYYLGSDVGTKFYNDVYKYIYADRDGDRILVTKPSSGKIITNSGASGDIKKIIAEIELGDDFGLDAELLAKTSAEINKTISTDFNNKFGYGMYDIAISDDKSSLTFSYDVVMFTGIGSTGVLEYSDVDEDAKSASVTEFIVDENGGGAFATVVANTVVVYNYDKDKGYVADTDRDKYFEVDGNDFAAVFSEPTLRLRTDLEGNDASSKIDINGEYGGGKNVYLDKKYNTDLYVGESRKIDLSSFFNVTGSRISFAYENAADSNAMSSFNKEFSDDTGHNTPVVTLTNSSLTIRPTTTAPIDLTVDIMRFADNNRTVRFKDGEHYDEKISVTFRFTNIIGFVLNKTEAPTKYLVTKDSVIDLFGETAGVNLLNASNPYINITSSRGGAVSNAALADLKDKATIFGLKTSAGNETFTCNYTDDSHKAIIIKPFNSGSGIIEFAANIYGETKHFSITINVRAVTTLPFSQRVTIVDDQYLSVQDLTTKLVAANSFNNSIDADMSDYKILFDDIQNPDAKKTERIYNAISFTDSNGNPGTPAFIKNVIFEGSGENANIRIISNNTSTQNSQTYYMHIKYTNDNVDKYERAAEGTVITMVVPVVSGKVKLQNPTVGGDLTANIDCRHPQNSSNWWTTEGSGLDTKVTIDLAYLLEIDEADGADQYKIFLISSDSAASSYFNYSIGSGDRSIIITPIDNTPLRKDKTRQTFELNVSVYKEGENNSNKVYAIDVSVSGILTTLPVTTEDGVIGYGNIWLYSFIIVFGVLTIIFVIRFIVYMRKRAKQRAIIRRNQELIRMRDRMHGKATAATKEQIVRTKLKMEDPKYAKLFNEMRKDKENESGILLENSDLAATADKKTKKKKKKGGKKTVAELKAELEAKKAAFAAAQTQNTPVNPFVSEVPVEGADMSPGGGEFVDQGGFADNGEFGGYDGYSSDGGFGGDAGFGSQDIDGNEIIFDASDIGDGM